MSKCEGLRQRCQKILNELRKDFPILKNKEITLKIKKMKKFSMFAKGAVTRKLMIIIDPVKYKDANDIEITGALVHELTHFEYYMKINLFYRIFNYLGYKLSRKYARNLELNTDKETIRKGYAKELYANRKFRLKRLSVKAKKIITNYLSPAEIKAYAKKIGK